MARPNAEVESLLQEYADLLQITGGDAFKARAYEKAARAVGGHHEDVSRLGAKELRAIPGVGRSIADKVEEYVRTGRVADLERVREKIPAGVRELMAVPTLGPATALTLHRELGVSSVAGLEEALRARKLRDLKGFGPRSEEKLLHGIGLMRAAGERFPLDTARELAEEIVAGLSAVPGCERCAYAGSLRRGTATVGDVDVLAAARAGRAARAVTDAFLAAPYVTEVIAHGGTKTSVRTDRGLQVDLRVLPPVSWGAGLLYFTGSKAHNIKVREIAVRRGLKLSEYGLHQAKSGRRTRARSEEEIYARLGMAWVPPALREDNGEVEAALEGTLPALLEDGALRGDLHTHTDLTDGVAPLEDMVAAAARRGYAYYAVTDHAPDLAMQRMTREKALAQRSRLRELEGRRGGLRLLHGTELNIGPDGSVDWPEDFLAGFDVCVASVHSHFDQDRETVTRRLLRACEHPYVHVIGHPSARMAGRRGELDADWDAVFEACARTGTALEINGQPHRLDLPDARVAHAKRYGVRFAVDSDAHTAPALGTVRYGVEVARRGWLTADDVINTWPWKRLRSFLDGKPDRVRRAAGAR